MELFSPLESPSAKRTGFLFLDPLQLNLILSDLEGFSLSSVFSVVKGFDVTTRRDGKILAPVTQ
jgi:hypothetical protein